MPELPEVETVKKVLEPQLTGLEIIDTVINNHQVIAYPRAEDFRIRLNGRTIKSMGRRGKFLFIYLDNGSRLVIHLRMTGRLLIAPTDFETEKHTHIIFRLSDERELRFIDQRRFGRMWLAENEDELVFTGIKKLGPEPFDPEFCAEYLDNSLSRRKKAIKECLLDQSIIAGIGNIYADEILFRCGINPAKPAGKLSRKDIEMLALTIPVVLKYYIEKNSISAEDYLAGKGNDYRNTPFFKVYGHAQSPCPVCGEIFAKTKVGNRTSVYCPFCQPK